jgi:hypothetical protein
MCVACSYTVWFFFSFLYICVNVLATIHYYAIILLKSYCNHDIVTMSLISSSMGINFKLNIFFFNEEKLVRREYHQSRPLKLINYASVSYVLVVIYFFTYFFFLSFLTTLLAWLEEIFSYFFFPFGYFISIYSFRINS